MQAMASVADVFLYITVMGSMIQIYCTSTSTWWALALCLPSFIMHFFLSKKGPTKGGIRLKSYNDDKLVQLEYVAVLNFYAWKNLLVTMSARQWFTSKLFIFCNTSYSSNCAILVCNRELLFFYSCDSRLRRYGLVHVQPNFCNINNANIFHGNVAFWFKFFGWSNVYNRKATCCYDAARLYVVSLRCKDYFQSKIAHHWTKAKEQGVGFAK